MLSPTEKAKGNSGKEPKNSIKWPWCPKTPSDDPMEKKKNLGAVYIYILIQNISYF